MLKRKIFKKSRKKPPVTGCLGYSNSCKHCATGKLFYYDLLILPSNESLAVVTIYVAFSDRQHQFCQCSAHAMGGITWHSHPNSPRNTAKWNRGLLTYTAHAEWRGLQSLLPALSQAPLHSLLCPDPGRQAHPRLFAFLSPTKSRAPQAPQDSQLPTEGRCWL